MQGRNEGSDPVKLIYPAFINGVDATDFSLIQQPISDTILPVGGSATYAVAFAPRPGINAQRVGSLHVRTDQTTIPEVVTRLAGNYVRLNLQGPRVIDVGLVQAGTPVTLVERYTNASGGRITVDRIRSSRPAELSVTPGSFSLDNGSGQDISIRIDPLIEGAYEDTLVFVTSEPCVDSVTLVVRWTVEAAELGVQNVLDFGTLPNCTTRREKITIANTSAFTVELVDAAITGGDAALFTIVNPEVVTATTLAAGATVEVLIDFDPRGSTDGLKSALLVTRARLNGTLTSFNTILEGIRQTSIPSTPGVVAFGNVDVLSSSTITVSVVNTSSTPLRIARVRMRSTPSVFTPNTSGLPKDLAPGERLDIDVVFVPTEAGQFVDSIIVEVDQPCADQSPIPVYGTGLLNVEFSLALPELTINPTDDNVTLPVRGFIATGTAETAQTSLDVVISFESSLFVAQRIIPGTIVRNEVVGGRTQLEISVPSTTITKTEGVVFEIAGQATLGSLTATDLTFERAIASAEGTTPKVRTRNGWLLSQICEAGGPRLIRSAGALSIVATPTPASDVLSFTVTVYERGEHTINVVDATGLVVSTFTWLNDTPGTQSFTIPASQFGSGLYHIQLSTPTRTRSTTALIVH